MGYINCKHCGSSNKETDTKCYNCESGLEAPAPVVPNLTRNPKQARLIDEAGGVQTGRTMDRDSTWRDGLRSGLKVGLLGALFLSLFNFSLLALPGGPALFAQTFVGNVAFAVLIGLCAGQLNLLCYRYDAVKVGSTIGFIWAIKTLHLYGIVSGGAFGGLVGGMCWYVEKRRRGQHAELW